MKLVEGDQTTLYLDGGGLWIEKVTSGLGVVTWNNYLFAGDAGMIGVRFEKSDGTVRTRYFHKDHLGSVQRLTDETGAAVDTESYDAWGKRRYPNAHPDDGNLPASQTTRAFTGHEQLDVGLVHMNGRVYDPQIGRFMSADPVVETPLAARAGTVTPMSATTR